MSLNAKSNEIHGDLNLCLIFKVVYILSILTEHWSEHLQVKLFSFFCPISRYVIDIHYLKACKLRIELFHRCCQACIIVSKRNFKQKIIVNNNHNNGRSV